MVIKYHISPFPSLLEDMLVRIWEAESDGPQGWVYEQIIPAPHDNPTSITVNGMDKVTHIVRLYSKDSLQLLHEYNVEPLTDTVSVFDPIRFKIGDGGQYTPPASDENDISDTFTHPALAGLGAEDYLVFRNNYGYIFPGTHYNNISEGFVLNNGDGFNDGEEFLILRVPKTIQTVVNDSVVGKLFKDFLDVEANTSFIADHLRKLIRFNGSPTYEFLAPNTVPTGYIFSFQHFGTIDGTAKVKFSNGPLKWGAGQKSEINIPRFTEGAFVFDGQYWNVIFLTDSSWVDSGEVVSGYPPGSIVAAGKMEINYPSYVQGDLPYGNPDFVVVHGKNISGDYSVHLSFESKNPADFIRDNRITYSWWTVAGTKANMFHFSPEEIAAEQQNVRVHWLIIKL